MAEKNPLLHGNVNSWVLGYVTALGAVTSARTTDSQGIIAWVENFCRANPLTGVHEAAGALVLELSKPQ
jgi:hypothetical protein